MKKGLTYQKVAYILVFLLIFFLLLKFIPKIAYGLGAIVLLVLLMRAYSPTVDISDLQKKG